MEVRELDCRLRVAQIICCIQPFQRPAEDETAEPLAVIVINVVGIALAADQLLDALLHETIVQRFQFNLDPGIGCEGFIGQFLFGSG